MVCKILFACIIILIFYFYCLLLIFRQYIVWAKRVEIVARSIGTEHHEGLKKGCIALPPRNQFGPKDLKRLFALPDKLSKNISVAQQLNYCEEWYSELSSLGIELTREPNFLNLKDLTKLEASTLTAQKKEDIARDKKRIGEESIQRSCGGLNYSGQISCAYLFLFGSF